MPIEITMPRLSDTMEQGTIIKWHVTAGDDVSAGDVLADVETDKATMEMQSFDDGTVGSISVEEGQAVEVGTVLAVLLEEDESADDLGTASSTPTPSEDSPPTPTPPPVAVADVHRPAAAETKPPSSPLRMTPVARRLAEEHGIDPASLVGSGPAGRIIKRDVLAAAEAGRETQAAIPPSAAPVPTSLAPAPATVPVTPVSNGPQMNVVELPGALQARTEPHTGMRQTIATRLVQSKQMIPHYQVTASFNVDPLIELRSSLNEQLESSGSKISVNDLVVRACALAMYENPLMNASWGGEAIIYHGSVNIGVAIALPEERGGGLVVATIRDADRKSIRIISAETRALSEKARTKGLTVDEMADSTFTISNLGMFGVEDFTAIINPPNSAILAVGGAIQKPVVRDGQLAIGTEMKATLSNDHRIIDGATAARYLMTVREFIEHPAKILA